MPLRLTVEPLGMTFAGVAAVMAAELALFHRLHARQPGKAPDPLLCLLRACHRQRAGIAFAGNLLTLFLFYEVLTLIDLSAGHPQGHRSDAGGRLYLGILMGTSIGFPAAGGDLDVWQVAGTTDFTPAAFWPAYGQGRRWRCCWRCSCSASARRR
jgi:multicomponent Na+:H+ antiporter subunit D